MYKFNIKANSKDGSHQTAPGYMLTFLRWSNRDTYNYDQVDPQELRKPFIVISDCIDLQVSSAKSSHTPSASMTLVGGDINYATAIAPGDLLFINMVDDEELINDLYLRATKRQPINKFKDGFKGFFRVQSVRSTIGIDPASGMKQVLYQISAFGFTEFNQIVYFNQYLIDKTDQDRAIGYLASATKDFLSLQNKKGFVSIDETFKLLISLIIGDGFPSDYLPNKDGNVRNPNKNFLLPQAVGDLMGLGSIKRAADIFTYYLGVQKYSGGSNPQTGFFPSNATRNGTFVQSNNTLSGATYPKAEFWNQNTAWSILCQYANLAINEIFVSYKLNEDGYVVPSVTLRQKPFTTPWFKSNFPSFSLPTTEYLTLPRWNLDLSMVYNFNIGRDEAARFNFVQVNGSSDITDPSIALAIQSSRVNYVFDEKDVLRSGLKPYILQVGFDYIGPNAKETLSPQWSKLVYDWVSYGHLKQNGSITCAGLYEPIQPGDNLEFDGVVYHIESVNHHMHMQGDMKSFDTQLAVSFGLDAKATAANIAYPEMDFTDAVTRRQQSPDLYPGISDTQDIPGRTQGEELSKTKEESFNLSKKRLV